MGEDLQRNLPDGLDFTQNPSHLAHAQPFGDGFELPQAVSPDEVRRAEGYGGLCDAEAREAAESLRMLALLALGCAGRRR